ncbi:hypothetical protein [Amycolatopsis sp. Hca4]|uniref:hypothetical protein n=1 Tax=Amycolatopsis sp. Hca4 TaxID=2742131 RepID=UPI0015907058|nr:hypothetical protein [Amycolatopsis sp. Hca4]QKV72719.1 hypothetical protein HUT10_01835 [Amycolatopsis sp. Hca4]
MMHEWFAVRCVFQWNEAGRRPYEERLTVWRAAGMEGALAAAEAEAREYAEAMGATYLGLTQGYETGLVELASGSEVFSLLRDSPLPPEEYLDRHFDTGSEHQNTT